MGIPTAAIVGAASYESASMADVVLAAPTQPSIGLGVIVVDAIVYTLGEALRWQYQERFVGFDQTIEKLFERIQTGGNN
jgi:hypothetical protein